MGTKAPSVLPIRLAGGAVVAFWVLVSIGGMENGQYRQYEQFLSSLAADGVAQPQWALGALVILAVAQVVLLPTLFRWRRFVGGALALATVALIALTAFRVSCPPHAHFCTPANGYPDADVLHAVGVLVYTGSMIAMIVMAAWQGRVGPSRRVRALPVVLIAVDLTLIGGPLLLTVDGLIQRFLLLAGQVGMVLAGVVADGELRRRHRLQLRVLAFGGTEPIAWGTRTAAESPESVQTGR